MPAKLPVASPAGPEKSPTHHVAIEIEEMQ
jgi:hypothetical protein